MEAAGSSESWYLCTSLNGKIPENSHSSLPIREYKIDRKFDLNVLFPVARHAVVATRKQGSWVQITV